MFSVLKEQLEERLANLEDRLENDYHSFGDAEEVAHERGKVRGYKEVLELIAKLNVCDRHECDYYKHYLAYGPPELSHDEYHAASAKCAHWQTKALTWYDEHETGPVPTHIEQQCRFWEAKVRA